MPKTFFLTGGSGISARPSPKLPPNLTDPTAATVADRDPLGSRKG